MFAASERRWKPAVNADNRGEAHQAERRDEPNVIARGLVEPDHHLVVNAGIVGEKV